MAELNIIRPPTKQEQKNMKVIGSRQPQDEFNEKMHTKMQEAAKKSMPFADRACKEEWMEAHRLEARRLLNKYGKGYLTEEAIAEYEHPEIEWDKYTNLDNFELVEEDEKYDEHLSKRNNKPIYLKYKVYKFKGYAKKYTIMEPYPDAWKDEKNTVSEVPNDGQKKGKSAKK